MADIKELYNRTTITFYKMRRRLRRIPQLEPKLLLLIGCAYLVLLFAFLLYGFLFCSDLRFSAFYDQTEQIQIQMERDTKNEAAAVRYIENLLKRKAPLPTTWQDLNAVNVELCMVVVTVPRERRYLYQTVSSILLSGCDDNLQICPLSSSIPSLKLHVLYTHPEPHPDFEALATAPNLHPHLTLLTRANFKITTETRNWYRAERADYVTALQFCRDEYEKSKLTGADSRHLTLIVEDDTVTSRNAVDKLIKGVEPLRSRNDWLLVRLYRSAYWDGWEDVDWPVLVVLGVVGAAIGTVVAVTIGLGTSSVPAPEGKELLPGSRPGSPGIVSPGPNQLKALLFVIIVSGLSIVCVLLALDKQNLPFTRPRSAGLHVDDASAGTIAVLYSSTHINQLVKFLLSSDLPPDTPIDVALNLFMEQSGLKQFQLMPDLFDHRGVITSADGKNNKRYQDLKVSSSFVDEVDIPHFAEKLTSRTQ